MKIAIVGAGIIGVTTAYELAVDGHQVTVFERRGAVAEEASFANAGVIAPGAVTPWAAPGMPGKVARYLFSRHAPVRVSLPLTSAEIGWMWKWHRACKLEGAEIEMNWWELPASNRQSNATSVMAIAALRGQTQSVAEAFEAHGLDVVAVDSVPTALERACSVLAAEGMALVADLGVEAATLALIGGGRVIYHRNIAELGIGILRRSIADELQLEDQDIDCVLLECELLTSDETRPSEFTPRRSRLRGMILRHVAAIGDELASSLTYAAHKYNQTRVNGVFLTGGGARLLGIESALARRLGIAVSSATPARIARIPTHLREVGASPTHSIACGLAMNTMDVSNANDVTKL